eukprot:SAG22_NODE_500_length_9715_cov_29.986793_8_plen_382_part_00
MPRPTRPAPRRGPAPAMGVFPRPFLLLLLLLLSSPPAAAAGQETEMSSPCGWTDPVSKVSFDLSALTAKAAYQFRGTIGSHDSLAAPAADGGEPAAVITPAASNHFEDYTYFVNLCKDVSFHETGISEQKLNPCEGKPPAAVYQIFRDSLSPACFALGSSAAMEWALLDQDDPNKGLSLTYSGGEICNKRIETPGEPPAPDEQEPPPPPPPENPDEPPPPPPYVYVEPVVAWEEIPRKVTLNLTCDPDQGDDMASVIAMAGKVHASEPEMCEYTIVWPTRLACPTSFHLGYDGEALTHTAKASYSAGGASYSGGGGGGTFLWWIVALGVLAGMVQGLRENTRSSLVRMAPGPLKSFLEPGSGLGFGGLLGTTGSPRGGKQF